MAPRRHLRTRPAPPHRALDHPPESIFDAPRTEEVASRDGAAHHMLPPRERPPEAPQLQPQLHQQPQKQSDAADWDTRATILLAEALAVTVIVGTVLFFCLRKHRRRLTQRRVFTAQQLQEWATIRIPATGEGGRIVVVAPSPGRNGRRTRMDSNASGMSIVSVDRDGRIRVDSAPLGEAPARLPAPHGSTSSDNNYREETADEIRTRAQRIREAILFVPRTIGSALMYPLRALEAGVNDWATENQDEIFLRQFIERLEAEREAALESPEQREKRLKEAFMKECMVWKLDEEHFVPPQPLFAAFGGDDRDDMFKPAKGGDAPRDDTEELNYGLYSLGEGGEDVLGDMEQGNMETIPEAEHVQGLMEVTDGEAGRGVEGEGKIENEKPADDTPAEEKESIGAPGAIIKEADVAVDGCEADTAGNSPASETVLENLSKDEGLVVKEPTSLMMEEVRVCAASLEQLPSAISAAEDTFDSESAPGYLYLSSSGHNRRRANTGGSISTANRSTLSTAESMESFGSASDPSADSHKIPNECAICLCDYEPGEVVVASSNGECPHAFHQECIVEWLVKMQEGTPCPCCRRTFVELDEQTPNGARTGNAASQNNGNSNNGASDAAQDPEEAERQRQERRRRHLELGIQGGRAFNTAVISVRSSSQSSNDAARTPEEVERRRQERLERRRRHIELGARRGRAFNTAVISMR